MFSIPGIVERIKPRTQFGAPIAFTFTCKTEGAAASMRMKQKSPHSSHANRENNAAFV